MTTPTPTPAAGGSYRYEDGKLVPNTATPPATPPTPPAAPAQADEPAGKKEPKK